MLKEKCKFILDFYGEEAQAKQTIQEICELVVGITKNDISNITEEIADVEIMLEQFKMFEALDEGVFKNIKIAYKEAFKCRKEILEERTIEALLKVATDIAVQARVNATQQIAKVEIFMDEYIKLRGISREDIDAIKENKVKRQLKRITDSKKGR